MAYTIETISGKVERVKADGHAFLLDNGEWYNNKFNTLPATIGAGSNIVFKSKGPFWQSFESIDGGTPASAPTGASATPKASTRSYSSNQRVFPVPLEDGSRSIIRQNSLTHATKLISSVIETVGVSALVDNSDGDDFMGIGSTEGLTLPEIVEKVARKFEMYSAGDVERMRAEGTLPE